MEQKTDFEICRFQVVVDLSMGGLVKIERGLGFHYNLFIDDHIQALHSQFGPVVVDTGGKLTRHAVTSRA